LSSQLINGQFYFFGRNKVQYEKFNWSVLKTEHFNIYYYNEFGEMAEIGAKYAEEAYEDLKIKFNHVVTNKIPLIFYNTHLDFQQTNIHPGFIPEGVGGFFEFLKGRVVIPFLGELYQFRHVIRHELVHVFMTNKIYHIISNHRLFVEAMPPLWFVEGLAEFWSTEWDLLGEMVLRDAVLNGMFVRLKDIDRIYGSFVMYKEGQSFLEFVKKEYGEENVLLFIENFWRFSKFTEVIEFTLGEPIDLVDEKWEYSLRKKYFPLYTDHSPFALVTQKLTKEGFNFSPSYFENGDERSLYFIGNHDGYSAVYQLPLDPKLRPLDVPFKIVQGEKTSVFESFHLMKPSVSSTNLGLVAFVTKSGKSDAIHLYSIPDHKVIKNYKFDNLKTIQSPSFSNDGDTIVFNSVDQKGFSDLFIIDLKTEELKRLTNDYYTDQDPIFSKDGNEVIFVSDRTSGAFRMKKNLFKYDLQTGEIEYLTYVNANISNPRFTPSGDQLYFLSDIQGVNNIWKLEYDDNGIQSGMTRQSSFLTSILEFTTVDDEHLILSAIEKFTFQFYAYNLNDYPDSLKEYKNFNFNLTDRKWAAQKLYVDPKKDKVKYKRSYTLDYAITQVIADPIFGARGGALFALSDLLGDDKYNFFIYNNAEINTEFLKNLNISITKINSKYRSNYAYGLFHFNGRRYDIRESDDFFYERSFGGSFALFFPFSIFNRIELNVSMIKQNRQYFLDQTPIKALLLSNTISYVHDNSLWGSTGPIDGSRFRILLGYTSDIKFSNQNFVTFIGDFRQYFRLGKSTALAARAALFKEEEPAVT